jgi:hypothetical protein
MSALKQQVGGSHYTKYPIQPVQYVQANRLRYLESSVIKYVTRHQDKGGAQDIRKAIHCLELLLQLEYGESDGGTSV